MRKYRILGIDGDRCIIGGIENKKFIQKVTGQNMGYLIEEENVRFINETSQDIIIRDADSDVIDGEIEVTVYDWIIRSNSEKIDWEEKYDMFKVFTDEDKAYKYLIGVRGLV